MTPPREHWQIYRKLAEVANQYLEKGSMANLFVDVDDTLVLYDKAGPNPYGVYMGTSWSANEPLIEGIKQFAQDNPDAVIVIWSGGGKDYAGMWAHHLRLDGLMVAMDKDDMAVKELIRDGDIVVDDMDVSWRTHAPDAWPPAPEPAPPVPGD